MTLAPTQRAAIVRLLDTMKTEQAKIAEDFDNAEPEKIVPGQVLDAIASLASAQSALCSIIADTLRR